ncbi:potassium channel family protein [Devosia naphthalenivorans]|uniref:potassium channel family protein n=1 Tax=Devosia naphthalenivorans TaxID=2082392 RepID=UPI000D3D8B9C|nr:potassium channel family protein [Devosia naphthalenivorans]
MPASIYALAVGSMLIGLTVLVHVLGLISITKAATALGKRFRLSGQSHRVGVMVGIVISLFAVATLEIWIWAFCYLMLGVGPDFDSTLYLSTITYSTVGYGDIVPTHSWRLLAALEGVTGFLMIGWSTAYLVTAGTKFGPFRSGEHF